MMPIDSAIARCERDLRMGSALRFGLVAGIAGLMFFGGALGLTGASVLLAIGVLWIVWMALNFQSVKASRLAAASPPLIAAGQFDLAEAQLDEAIRSFSIFRAVKLTCLHYLAVLRHAQRRWPEAARASRALLNQRLGPSSNLSIRSRLILADALLEMGDLHGAYQALVTLYSQRLSLSEAINLTIVQVEYQARVGDWAGITQGIGRKVELAELMPAPASVRVQALLALAAKRAGQNEWANWLKGRVELLADVNELQSARPMLAELWA